MGEGGGGGAGPGMAAEGMGLTAAFLINELTGAGPTAREAAEAQTSILQDQAGGADIPSQILGRQGSDFNAGPFFRFGGKNTTSGGLRDDQLRQLTPQFAKAAAMAQLLGIGSGTGAISTAATEQQALDKQSQESAAVIAGIISDLSKNKRNVDPGTTADPSKFGTNADGSTY